MVESPHGPIHTVISKMSLEKTKNWTKAKSIAVFTREVNSEINTTVHEKDIRSSKFSSDECF